MRSNFNHCDVKSQQKPVRREGSGKNEEGSRRVRRKGVQWETGMDRKKNMERRPNFFVVVKISPPPPPPYKLIRA
jgi:hypothetical protein